METSQSSIQSKLNKLGLTDKEASIYSALLHLGGAYPSKIAEVTKINRSTVYKILLDLSVKGLVNEIEKKNKIFYHVEHPQRITRYLKDRVKISQDQLEKAESTIPTLESIYAFSAHKQKVTYFEGFDGILQVFEDHINVDKPYEMLAWSNTEYLENFMQHELSVTYRKAKEKKRIHTRGIVPASDHGSAFILEKYKQIGVSEKYWPELRFVSKDQFLVHGEITVYGEDKISIVNLNPDSMTGTIIQDKAIHDMMRMIFELSWKGAAQK